ncbi:TIR domain-containing protein [Sphingomonas sp.]|uniref:TIR domain-containing protein n=1 Tax=Sphingomonas sp. TaxID=28214 RepID=UPI00286A4A3C|nr:TIR domain-containing protein [Sphingomonas sp.]
MASVFLSYSREDGETAAAVAAALEQRGHSVWWDQQVQGGSRFSQEIDRALKRSDAVLVLWSDSSVESAWVQDEAAEGRDSARLVPAIIDGSKPPLGFRQYQAIDLSGWTGRGKGGAIESLHQAIIAKTSASCATVEVPRPFRAAGGHHQLAKAGFGVLTLVVAGLITWFAWPSTPSNEGALRLQLGEFKALSRDVPETIPDTLREEILAALATDAVIVTSSEKPKAGAPSGYALSASVRTTEAMIRFTLHVVDERTGGSVWTGTFDRPAGQTDVAPRQVAVAASQVLRCGLGGAARYRKPLADKTLSIFFNYCEEYWADTAGKKMNPTRALDLARRVVAAAPDFSGGWSALAEVATLIQKGDQIRKGAGLRDEAKKAAERALKLDKQNSEAYQALASLQPPFAYAQREKLHLKSIAVRPSDCGCEYMGYGAFLNRVGRNAEAVDAFKRAHDMIPLSADVIANVAESLFVGGRADEARQNATEALKAWPNYSFMRKVLVRSAFWTGRYDEALKLLADPSTELSQKQRSALAAALRALQSSNAAAKTNARESLMQLAGDGSADGALLITALAALGANDEALAVAAGRVERDGPRALPVLFEPALATARRSPKFAQIAQRFGLANYWRESRHLPDFCKEASPPALCTNL